MELTYQLKEGWKYLKGIWSNKILILFDALKSLTNADFLIVFPKRKKITKING